MEIKIVIPDGMEIDKENSTFECIKFKPKERSIKTWNGLIGIGITGYFITKNSNIKIDYISSDKDKNIARSEKHCKSMLAMAQISQLMPFYGGAITDEEWNDGSFIKYTIERNGCKIQKGGWCLLYNFLAFRTKEYCISFLKNNEQLVKDYLMLD